MKLLCSDYMSMRLRSLYKPIVLCGLITVVTLASVLAVSRTVSAVSLYRVVDLGTLGGSSSLGNSINNLGQATGRAEIPGDVSRAFLYDYASRSMVVLPPDPSYPGLTTRHGYGINDSGEVTGSLSDGDANDARAFLYSGGTTDNIGNRFFSNGWSPGMAINDSGQIVGNRGNDPNAWVYNSSTDSIIDIVPLVGDASVNGQGINNLGQVTGESRNLNGTSRVYIDSGGVKDDLGTLGGDLGEGNDINDLGHVVGYSETSGGEIHGFYYNGSGSLIDIGHLGGGYSNARAINESDQIVGQSDVHAFLYENGTMYNLNSLIPQNSGWTLSTANDINDNGWIIGQGQIGSENHAMILIPTPEPTTIVLLGIGIAGLVGAEVRRRRKKKLVDKS